ncbi:MAG: 6-phosphofructokinase [Alphaproteobacteria bacterium]|nr:6-phosphofructokinase [Alphaproteobacteria bacterium]
MAEPHPDLPSQYWGEAYRRLSTDLPDMAKVAPLALCGMSACTDARIELDKMTSLLDAEEPAARAFADLLLGRAAKGIGGEVRVDWPEGPQWLLEREQFQFALGGTGPQAAWVLSVIGAPALMALEDRCVHMLARVPDDVLLVEDGKPVPRRHVQPRGVQRPDIYIIEFTKGVGIRGVVPPRSSRIIVRFGDPGLEHDDGFDAVSVRLAAEAGTGLVSGFNCVTAHDLPNETRRVFSLTRRWRSAGLACVHLELAGYDAPELRDQVLASAAGAITSLGMSHSEFRQLLPDNDSLADGMATIGERLGLNRVCVHADEWAAAVTLGDPATEERALMTGCLLASSRASAGRPIAPAGVPNGASFADPPRVAGSKVGRWAFVSAAAPYLPHPASTLGLGDAFTAGCLLALGCGSRRTA